MNFNGRLRDELLSSETFATLAEAELLVDRCRLQYNLRRTQRALGKLTSAAIPFRPGGAAAPARCARLRYGTAGPERDGYHASALVRNGLMRATPPRTRLDFPSAIEITLWLLADRSADVTAPSNLLQVRNGFDRYGHPLRRTWCL